MAFNGTEGGEITLELGADMTAEYRDLNPNERKAHFYGKDILNDLLDQEGCMGIRIYFGIDSDGNKELVLVGADANENDMTELVVDISSPCPNLCDKNSPLNK